MNEEVARVVSNRVITGDTFVEVFRSPSSANAVAVRFTRYDSTWETVDRCN